MATRCSDRALRLRRGRRYKPRPHGGIRCTPLRGSLRRSPSRCSAGIPGKLSKTYANRGRYIIRMRLPGSAGIANKTCTVRLHRILSSAAWRKGVTLSQMDQLGGPSKRSSGGTRNRHFSYVEREVVLDLKPPADLWHFEFDLAQHDMLLHSARPQ